MADGPAQRLSMGGDDVVNKRSSYRKTKNPLPPKQSGGCCGSDPEPESVDYLFVGGGIVSAMVSSMILELEPGKKIHVYEGLDRCGTESSDGFNNAGTGHAGLCELNYTPETKDGVNVDKAVMINHQFQQTREYLTYLTKEEILKDTSYINPTPHMSFCIGDDGVKYLKERHRKLTEHPCGLFKSMKYSEDFEQIKQWAPLLMEGRNPGEKYAATYAEEGSDVDFGNLTRALLEGSMKKGLQLYTEHTVTKIQKQKDTTWLVKVKSDNMGRGYKWVRAKFVCVGAGGMALTLLRAAGVAEVGGYGAFPISGQWLVCQDQAVANKHNTKVYGQASVGAPPMSVPHLDARIINGRKYTLFGPYAGWSPRFLKSGSLTDWFSSVLSCAGLKALPPMTCAGLKNIDLVFYLFGELTASRRHMLASLLRYYPTANGNDWTLVTAGQRVCIMKPEAEKSCNKCCSGLLQFGTEVVASKDGTITGLLGASPGASTTVSIALDILHKVFPDKIAGWEEKLKKMVPSYDPSNPKHYNSERALAGQAETAAVLGLNCPGSN